MSNGIYYTLGLDTSPLKAGITSALGLVGGMGAKLGLVGIGAGMAGVGAAALVMKKSLDAASQMQGFEVGFEVLLGSLSAAKVRMGELAKFAADTPFELPEVAQASRTLETLTKGALSTGKGLTLVGDVASGTQQSFGELAVWIGRLYDGLQSGRPVGEALARMQELGVVSGEVRARIEALQAAGKKGDVVWDVAAESLGRFSGMMAKQSQTWSGLMSTLSDDIGAVFREFGTPVMESLTPMLKEGISFAETMAPLAKELGTSFSSALNDATALFTSGQLGAALGESLKLGMMDAGNFGIGMFDGLFKSIPAALKLSIDSLLVPLKTVASMGFWTGLGNALAAAGVGFAGIIEDAVGKVLEGASKIKGLGGLAQPANYLLEQSRGNFDMMRDYTAQAKAGLAGVFDTSMAPLKDFGKAVAENIAEEVSRVQFFDTDKQRAEIKRLLDSASEQMRQIKVKDFLKERPKTPEGITSPETAVTGIDKSMASNADKLQKMGLFIRGAGGPAGQKANEETARNTRALIGVAREQVNAINNMDTGRFGHTV